MFLGRRRNWRIQFLRWGKILVVQDGHPIVVQGIISQRTGCGFWQPATAHQQHSSRATRKHVLVDCANWILHQKKKKREADSLIRDALQIQDPVLTDDGKAEVGIRIRLVHGYVCCIPLSVDAINMRACLEKVHGCVLKSILWDGIMMASGRCTCCIFRSHNSHSIVKTLECSI